jgi:CheY-like chemotaxis protein
MEDLPPLRPTARGAVILVAEDDEHVRTAIRRILEAAGYIVLLAADGEEAVRLFEARRAAIDLALLDVVMPKRGGRWVAGRLRASRPDVPLIFCTGYDPDTAEVAVDEFPNAATLVKPVEANQLLSAIQMKLEQARLYEA